MNQTSTEQENKIASTNTLCKKLLNVKGIIVESYNFYNDQDALHTSGSRPDQMPGI